jgi:hypothetical protein
LKENETKNGKTEGKKEQTKGIKKENSKHLEEDKRKDIIEEE